MPPRSAMSNARQAAANAETAALPAVREGETSSTSRSIDGASHRMSNTESPLARFARAEPARVLADIQRFQRELQLRDITVGGRIAETYLAADLLPPGWGRRIEQLAPTLTACLERAVQLFFLRSRELGRFYAVDDATAPLIEIDPRVPPGAPILVVGRIDGFLTADGFRAVEFNVDSPAGIGYADAFEKLLMRTDSFREVTAGLQLRRISRRHALLTGLMRHYKAFRAANDTAAFPARPRIAIADWTGTATSPEFEILSRYFSRHGVETMIVDPREFEFTPGKGTPALTARGRRIDLVYRRALVRELAARRDEIRALERAARDGAVCVANPFRSAVGSSKTVLELLTDPAFDAYFSPAQNRVRHSALAWTHRLAAGIVQHEGGTRDLEHLLLRDREEFVIKPAVGAAAAA
jgi:hypothetical protein